MTATSNTRTESDQYTGLLKIYKQAVDNVPLLKYGWIIIATICILALGAYFKLKNSDIFFYAIGVIVISFLGFLFSYLLKTTERFVRYLLYVLIACIVLTIGIAIISLGTFIIWKKPDFYSSWFPSTELSGKNSTNVNLSWEQDQFKIVIPPNAEIKVNIESTGLYESELNLQRTPHYHSSNGSPSLRYWNNYVQKGKDSFVRNSRGTLEYRNTTAENETLYLEPRHKFSPPNGQKPWNQFLQGKSTILSKTSISYGFEDAGDNDFDDLIITISSDRPLKIE